MTQSMQCEIDAARFERGELACHERFGEAREAFDDDGKARSVGLLHASHGLLQATTFSKPPRMLGIGCAEGGDCCGNACSAFAISATSPCAPSSGSGSVRERPRRSAASARMVCSKRGVWRGTMSARLSKERISQNVL